MKYEACHLTAKQARWVHEYLACGNASASAVKAGYSANGASVAGNRMLRNVRVQEALKARQQADATRLAFSRENVLQGLLEAFELAKAARNPVAMVSAARELGKMLGFYEPTRVKVDFGVQDEVLRFEAMSDGELAQIIRASGETAANKCYQ